MTRKYRHRGYMDYDSEDRTRAKEDDLKSQVSIASIMKILPCTHCGERNESLGAIKVATRCHRCDRALHSCLHCEFFDRKARFQCQKPLEEPIADKEEANACPLFAAKFARDASLNRPVTEEDARRALERLFKL